MHYSLTMYRRLATARWPRTYLGKFLFTAFLGVHVPLIALATYIALSINDWSVAAPFLLITLVATLLGTLATQLVQRQLLAPMLITSQALDNYVRQRSVPELPGSYTDEAGLLMGNAQFCITHLDDLLRMKDDLLAVLSHDTRLPLTTVSLASSLCLELLDDPEIDIDQIRELNMKISEAAARQTVMMESILMLARAGSGTIEPQWSRVTLGELIAQATENIGMQATSKGITFRVSDMTGADIPLQLDVAKTEQVLNNLLSNAVKFTPSGGSVELEGRVSDESVEITVRDSGLGIEPAAREQLFMRFSAAQRAGTARETGSGLGLWICKTFIELQGGDIDIESEPGVGTTFHVRLPRREATRRDELSSNRRELPEYQSE